MPIPRVGTTENERSPFSTSTRSTPSRRPPRSRRLVTEQRHGSGRPSAALFTERFDVQTSRLTSINTIVCILVYPLKLLLPGPRPPPISPLFSRDSGDLSIPGRFRPAFGTPFAADLPPVRT